MSENNRNTNKVVSGLFWVYLENISAQLVNFIVTIVLARLLEPVHYGTIALVSVFVSLASVFVSSGIGIALIQKKDADEKDYSSMFWFNLAVSIVLYLLLYFCAPLVGNYYGNDDLTQILRVLSLSIPLSAYNCIQQAYVTQKMIFKKSFLSNTGGTLISGILGVILALLGLGVWALVAQRLIAVALTTIILYLIVDWRPIKYFSMDRVRPLLSFGWKMMATGFMFTGYNELRSLIIGKRYSASDLGYYDRGFSFPRLIASNIDGTITRVLFPALAESQDSTLDLAAKTRRATKTSVYIMTPILFGLAIIAEPLVLLLLGEKWMPCVPYIQVMCLVWWLQPTQTCSIQAIKAIGRSDLYLNIEIISKIFGLTYLTLAVVYFDSAFAVALSMLVGQATSFIIYGILASKHIGYKVRGQLVDLMIPTIFSVIMCLAAFAIQQIIEKPLISVLIQVLICGGVYFLLSYITKNDTFMYIKGIAFQSLRHNK